MLVRKITVLIASLIVSTSALAQSTQLNYGKYFGSLQMDGSPNVIAVSLDAFVVQIKDPTVYPALNVIVRANLGGYSSSEYIGYNFYDPTFNFEKGILQLDDPKSELTATLKVTTTDAQTILEGPVTHRLTNSKGKMRVVMTLDAIDSASIPRAPAPFLSVLKGEYKGKCGKDLANLQIETARGLGAAIPGNALTGYSITGRLGFTNGPLCNLDQGNQFCSLYPYSTGTYSPFSNKLTLQSPRGTMDCARNGDVLECVAFGYDKSGPCTLSKKSGSTTSPVQIPSTIFLNVSPSQKTLLPSPKPPGNDELISALNGSFYGFLHYENRDIYQLIEMSVIATTSTENPHIQNQVMVEPTILLRLGSKWDAPPALSLYFPQRVFFLNQGFSFQADNDDYFAVIGDWRNGYVNGVMYSRTYGRVGTFEMQKGTQPVTSLNMAMLPSPTGHYQGPVDHPNPLFKKYYSLSIEFPNQTSTAPQDGLPLLSRYSGPSVMSTFDASSLDLNTGSMGFLIKLPTGDRLITGEMTANKNLKLLWPVGPALGAPMDGYNGFTYAPVNKN